MCIRDSDIARPKNWSGKDMPVVTPAAQMTLTGYRSGVLPLFTWKLFTEGLEKNVNIFT